ncbi:MAG TPA: cation:proton antiporter [Asanoa sp.]
MLLVVVLGATVLVGTTIARRHRVAPPVLLITFGGLLALIPRPSHVSLPPYAVLLLVRPPILYWESLNTSLREIRANLRVIILSAVVLVTVTMVAVSLSLQAVGGAASAAWILGAVLVPADAAAVAGLAKRMPRRILTTLRVESLINDGARSGRAHRSAPLVVCRRHRRRSRHGRRGGAGPAPPRRPAAEGRAEHPHAVPGRPAGPDRARRRGDGSSCRTPAQGWSGPGHASRRSPSGPRAVHAETACSSSATAARCSVPAGSAGRSVRQRVGGVPGRRPDVAGRRPAVRGTRPAAFDGHRGDPLLGPAPSD